MSDIDIIVLLAYVIFMMAVALYVSKKSISIMFFTFVILAIFGYGLHIPEFNLTMMTFLSMVIAGIIIYKLFLSGGNIK